MADETVNERQELLDQYEPEDTEFDPELDAQPVAPKAAKPVPPKDPETGKFVKPPTHTHPPGLVRSAKRLDFSDEEIENYPTAELADIVDRLTGERFNQYQRTVSAGSPPPERKEVTDEPTAPDASGFDVAAFKEEFAGYPALVKFADHVLDRLGTQDKQVKSFGDYVQREEGRRTTSEADQAFSKFGPEYESVFGKGNGDEVDMDSLMRRVNVLNSLKQFPIQGVSYQAAILKRGKQLHPATTLPPKREITLADEETEHVDDPAKAPPSRINREQWDEAALAPVNGRKAGPEPKGKRKATKAVAELLKRQASRNGDGPEEDDLP